MPTSQSSENNMGKIILAITLLVAAAVVYWWFSREDDDSALTSIAYPCLPIDKTTTDPAEFVMVTGYTSPPSVHTMPDGTVVYAIFSHPDPKVVPKVNGKTLYFPGRQVGEDGVETPPLPPHNKPLDQEHRWGLVRYLPDDAMQQLRSAVGAPPDSGTTP